MGDGIARVYVLNSCMAGEPLEFTATLELDLETSYRNTNLNLLILAGNRNLGQSINPSGAAN
jgi:hypothetical protein